MQICPTGSAGKPPANLAIVDDTGANDTDGLSIPPVSQVELGLLGTPSVPSGFIECGVELATPRVVRSEVPGLELGREVNHRRVVPHFGELM